MIVWLAVAGVVVVVGGLLGALAYVKMHADADEPADSAEAAPEGGGSDESSAESNSRASDALATVGRAVWAAAEKITRPPEEAAEEDADADTTADTTSPPPDTADSDDEPSEPAITRAEVAAAVAELRELVSRVAAVTQERAAGTDTKRARWRMAGAVVAVLGLIGGVAYVAVSGWGILAGGLFVGALVLGASGAPVAILVFRDGMPLGGLVGQGLAIAAQIAFGKAALVRRDDGRYEWTVLRERDEGYVARLADGREVPIDADDGELYAFGFGRLAVTEQKTEANLRRWMVAEGASDGGTETRAGIEVAPPQREHGGILVSLATIQRAVRGSASSTLVRRGRDKALDEEGGEQGVSQLWTMAFATVLLIVGFGMTFLALSL